MSEQTRPWDTLACCWDGSNQQTTTALVVSVRRETRGSKDNCAAHIQLCPTRLKLQYQQHCHNYRGRFCPWTLFCFRNSAWILRRNFHLHQLGCKKLTDSTQTDPNCKLGLNIGKAGCQSVNCVLFPSWRKRICHENNLNYLYPRQHLPRQMIYISGQRGNGTAGNNQVCHISVSTSAKAEILPSNTQSSLNKILRVPDQNGCISSMISSRDTPFWSGTLVLMHYLIKKIHIGSNPCILLL